MKLAGLSSLVIRNANALYTECAADVKREDATYWENLACVGVICYVVADEKKGDCDGGREEERW